MHNWDGRQEKRTRFETPMRLVCPREPGEDEVVQTENVSPYGARVLTKQSISRGELLFLTPLGREFRTSFRVVYCHATADGRFALGLIVLGLPVNWTLSPIDPLNP